MFRGRGGDADQFAASAEAYLARRGLAWCRNGRKRETRGKRGDDVATTLRFLRLSEDCSSQYEAVSVESARRGVVIETEVKTRKKVRSGH